MSSGYQFAGSRNKAHITESMLAWFVLEAWEKNGKMFEIVVVTETLDVSVFDRKVKRRLVHWKNRGQGLGHVPRELYPIHKWANKFKI
jgi:hypothetical protein